MLASFVYSELDHDPYRMQLNLIVTDGNTTTSDIRLTPDELSRKLESIQQNMYALIA